MEYEVVVEEVHIARLQLCNYGVLLRSKVNGVQSIGLLVCQL
jgi:hypothetical protein